MEEKKKWTKEQEHSLAKWMIYNIMAVERDILPKKEKKRFLDGIGKDLPGAQEHLDAAMTILNLTDITNEQILDVVFNLQYPK